jgi:AcrR family transcriptional regulator
MIDATVAALQRQGVAGMSFSDVLAASGAARGAIYHHFPGGKAQLVAEAAARNGADVCELLAALPADSPRAVVEAFLALVRPVIAASAAGGGCAVAAVTLGADAVTQGAAVPPGKVASYVVETGPGDALLRVAATAFVSWSDQLAERLIAAALPPGAAADLATTLITLLEGAHIMCRAAGSLDPFDQVARTALAFARLAAQEFA